MKCEICDRRVEKRFCEVHDQSLANLLNNYEAWKRAMDTSWAEYLKEILENPYAGLWVREVAQNLLASKPS